MKKPIVFFGASSFVLPILDVLRKEYDLKAVVTTEKNSLDAVPAYCNTQAIPYLSLDTFKNADWEEMAEQIVSWHIEVAVLADFGLIVPQRILDLFPKGIINIHPSRLPAYRGPTPGQTAILLGDIRTGVSVMLLDKDVDHGPLLAQEEEPIISTDTAATLYTRLFKKGAQMLAEVLPPYLTGQLLPQEQDHTKATFTKPLTRDSGFFDTTKPTSAELLDRMIRAYYPWPGVWTRYSQNTATLSGKIIKFLPGGLLQVEGKKPVSKKDFLNGYPEARAWLQKLQLL